MGFHRRRDSPALLSLTTAYRANTVRPILSFRLHDVICQYQSVAIDNELTIAPAYIACFLIAEMKEVEKTIRAFDEAENVADVGASRKQRVHGFDEITLIGEGTFMSLGAGTDASRPWPDASNVAARAAAFVVRAEEVYQVSTPRRSEVALASSLTHGRA